MNNEYYPIGAGNDPDAPYNVKEQEPRTITVTISMSLSKTVEIEVDDYEETVEQDEDGTYNSYYDYSNSNLYEAAKKQIKLPNETFKDWDEDDVAIVVEKG